MEEPVSALPADRGFRGLGASRMELPAMASGAGIALVMNLVFPNKNKDLWFFGILRSGKIAIRGGRVVKPARVDAICLANSVSV